MKLRFLVLGVVLVATGIVGFAVPALGSFVSLSPVYSAAHLAAGVCAIGAARRGIGPMRLIGKLLGAGFVILAVAGFLTDNTALASAHVFVAVVFLYHALLAPPTL